VCVCVCVFLCDSHTCLCNRLVLRCRQDARTRFAKMRSDVLVKLELLDNKHGTQLNSTQLSLSSFMHLHNSETVAQVCNQV